MKKNLSSEKKSSKKEQNSKDSKKPKGLFDHLTAIRTTKDPDYYNSLTDGERKGFSHWMILHGLSMDINLIPLVSYLWQDGYYDKIPSPQFYRLLMDVVPQTNQRLFWIKKSKKTNSKLLNHIAEWYSISTREAGDYLEIFSASDDGMKELANILEGLGLTDKEAEKVLSIEKEEE